MLEPIVKAYGKKITRWQLPDDAVLVDALPMTATGKVSKKDLRVKFREHVMPEVAGGLAT